MPQRKIQKYIDEQIYALRGVKQPQKHFSILLTGSRSTGTYTPYSDVDLDVLCPTPTYNRIQKAMLKKGIIRTINESTYFLTEENWRRYFGEKVGRSHFSLIPVDEIANHFVEYHDVYLWIWTNAKALTDPDRQFQKIRGKFKGYPKNILIEKIKYHWMLSAYWAADVFPYHHAKKDVLPAALSLINAVNELLKFFYIVEGKPFPYNEKLINFGHNTKLGKRFMPFILKVADLVTANKYKNKDVWGRLEKGNRMMNFNDKHSSCDELENACQKAMLKAGVSPKWVEADYGNMDELLLGKLGYVP